METDRFISLTAGTRGAPGHHVSPDDELRALFEAQALVRDLGRSIASRTKSPVQAVLFTQLAEDSHRNAVHTQLLAADTARRTLAHELPQETFTRITAIHDDPVPYVEGLLPLPEDPATVPTGRPVFKDTTAMLTGLLHISFFVARERMRSTDRLLPGTDLNGTPTPPRFPVLAGDLAHGTADPGQIGAAARKLESLVPQIDRHPDAATLAGTLEEQVAESVRTEDPRTTAKLLAGIQTALEQGEPEVPEEVLRAKTGLFYRGTTGGIGEFLLRTMPRDTEALLALCASTDNPRTKAGDRDGLLAQALATTVTTGTGTCAPTTANDAGTNGSNGQPGTPNEADTGSGFPDFLTDPATGAPLTDPAAIRALSLDPEGLGIPGTLFAGNGANGGPGGGRFDTGTMNASTAGGDGLTPPQRHLQGLVNLIRSAGQPRTGKKTIGIPSPTTFIIATLDELRELATTHGITSHGQKLTPAELRQALCNGGAVPMTLNGKSRILDLGQEERFFPDYMREAIIALYGGCIMPGCTVPPEHLEIHHFDFYADGGRTAIHLGAPCCPDAHHGFHAGLFKVVRDTDGLFSVILPKFMDPEQKPRRNTYWRTPEPRLF
ncbi:HNH endonuclease signature motif containing protein [Arthrobacter sp. AQ5-05]|uniref:HNH endonuclease signature motif containing protein n=1 Tax=Arthrobacter sp. AQ5-05 TaxID=2184581 RepID=UPI0025707E64|nr:HNH endonuclease signature motif containing protein [Arthrobacter sp. AQ5-05]